MNKSTKTLYTIVWGGHWEKYSEQWIEGVRGLNTQPDQIIIVSDKSIEGLKINKIYPKIIEVPRYDRDHKHGFYRNLAIKNSTSYWTVSSDIDDTLYPNALDFEETDKNVVAFNYFHNREKKVFFANNDLSTVKNQKTIYTSIEFNLPGTSAVKTEILKKYMYESETDEDKILWSRMLKYGDFSVEQRKDVNFKYNHVVEKHEFNRNFSEKYYLLMNQKKNPLWVFWLGDANMPINRKRSLSVLRKYSGCNVKLITDELVKKYEDKSEISIHPAFNYLTSVHKSDYLRAYFMYIYGGAYSDLKPYKENFSSHIDYLYGSNASFIGYREPNADAINRDYWNEDSDKDLIKESLSFFDKFSGYGKFIFKPGTEFAYDWLNGVHEILDNKYDLLEKSGTQKDPYLTSSGITHPTSGQVRESDIFYPIGWGEIGANVYHKIQYRENFLKNINMMDYEPFEKEEYR